MSGARRIAMLAAAAFAITLARVFLGLLVRGPLSAWIDHEIDLPPRSFSESHNNETVDRCRGDWATSARRASPARSPSSREPCCGDVDTARPAVLLAGGFLGAAFVTVVVKRAVSRQPASGPIPLSRPARSPQGTHCSL